jgi:putative ABC transport system permease protein
MLSQMTQDLRYAGRTLRKRPGFAAAAVLTLALGIGACTAMFSVVHAVVLQPLPYTHAERLMMLWEADKNGEQINVGYPTFADWRAQSHSFEAMSAMSYWNPTLSGANDPLALSGASVTAEFFSVLGVKPMLGRDFTAADDRPNAARVAIISYDLWQKSFNRDSSIIEKPVLLNGVPRTVIGVMPADFQPLLSPFNKRVDIWRPLTYAGEAPPACRTCRHLRVIGRVREGVTTAQARAELATIQQRIVTDHANDYSANGVVFTSVQEEFTGKVSAILLLLFGAVGFVVLIACANVANLMLVRTTSRRKEFALRMALGASRVRILRQLLTESVLLAIAGGGLGVLLTLFGIQWLLSLAPVTIPRIEQVEMSPPVLAFALGLSLLTSILFGILPALAGGKTDLHTDLKQGSRGSGFVGNRIVRNTLVIADVTLAMILLAGAGLMLKSMTRLLDVPSGISSDNVLTMRLSLFGPEFSGPDANAKVLATFKQSMERISELPGVKAAGLVSQLPLGGDFDMYGVEIQDKPPANPEDSPGAFRYGVTPGYLEALHIPILRGRSISLHDDEKSQLIVVVNELFATRIWPGEDAIGKQVRLGGPDRPWRTVVGIVGNVRHEGLDAPQKLQVYVPEAQWFNPDSDMVLTINTASQPLAIASAARQAVWSVNSNVRINEVASMDQVIGASVAPRRFPLTIFGLFAIAALLLAALGLYGVLAYSVSQRTTEIGVRMALGARPREVLRMVLREGMILVISGVVIGLLGALALKNVLTGLLFEVKATDPMTLILAAVVLIIVALAACLIPARRATRVDPLIALRYE